MLMRRRSLCIDTKFKIVAGYLKGAEKNMNDWMGQFNPDPKMPTTEQRSAYFQDQKEKATAMKNGFFAALKKADSLLAK